MRCVVATAESVRRGGVFAVLPRSTPHRNASTQRGDYNHSSRVAWLFLALRLSLRGRAISATSRLRMLPSHLRVTRAHLRIARHLIRCMGSVSGASSSPGSFAGVQFG